MTSLVHLGQLTPPGRRNARPGSKDYDYVDEYIKLKRWALQKFGKHEWKAFNDTDLPRISRREAIRMAKWWREVTQGVEGGYGIGDKVILGVHKMEVAAYGSADAAHKQRMPTGRALDEELTTAQAAFFWEGMSEVSVSLRAAKMRPTLFDKGLLLFESVLESAVELPERIIDTGKDITENVQAGIDRVIKVAKWTGIIGGGLLVTYVVTRIVPKRDPKALPPGRSEDES
jgi:hypothetical protein